MVGIERFKPSTCNLYPLGSDSQRGSLISSQEKIAGSSRYATFVIVFTLVSTLCLRKDGTWNLVDHKDLGVLPQNQWEIGGVP